MKDNPIPEGLGIYRKLIYGPHGVNPFAPILYKYLNPPGSKIECPI